jgi:hypothetical protein
VTSFTTFAFHRTFASKRFLDFIPAGDFSDLNFRFLSKSSVQKPFSHCVSLREVIFSAEGRLKSIGGFQSCPQLLRIEIPFSVEIIDSEAFSSCDSLRDVVFSAQSRLKLLGGFQSCRQLLGIEIPFSVEIIDLEAFFSCDSLWEVIFPAGSCLKSISGFELCPQLFRIEIPSFVEVINSMAFFCCGSLHEVVSTRDSHIQANDDFSQCESLSRIEIQSDFSFENSPFFTQHEKCLVFRKMSTEWSILFDVCSGCHMLDEPLIDIFENAASLRKSNIVSVDDKNVEISKISDRLFCLHMSQSIEIPSFIRSIGSCMRWMRMSLPTLVIPSSIEEIDGFSGFFSIELMSL